jgi:endonuclease/exonuclease/phosphatase family metal-dependent hydrolase
MRRRVAPEPCPAVRPPTGVTPDPDTSRAAPCSGADSRNRLRLLSYNIQTGIATAKYHHYVTHSWKHVLPHSQRVENLNAIAGFLGEFDIVGLQEVDGGSLRSGFINQTEYLAGRAEFPFWHDQTNRDLGKLAQHSIGLLSRLRPERLVEYRLPGMIPGRGVLSAHFGGGGDSELVVLILHLSLGQRARLRQLAFVSELINGCPHAVVMGDLNCRADSREMGWLLRNTALSAPRPDLHTFPSWRPLHNIDHILVTPSLTVERVEPLDHVFSDHLPLAMEVLLPQGLDLGSGGFQDPPLAVGL